jgi:hypothetical protein
VSVFAVPEPQPGAATLIAKYEAVASSRASSVATDPLDQHHQASPISPMLLCPDSRRSQQHGRTAFRPLHNYMNPTGQGEEYQWVCARGRHRRRSVCCYRGCQDHLPVDLVPCLPRAKHKTKPSSQVPSITSNDASYPTLCGETPRRGGSMGWREYIEEDLAGRCLHVPDAQDDHALCIYLSL